MYGTTSSNPTARRLAHLLPLLVALGCTGEPGADPSPIDAAADVAVDARGEDAADAALDAIADAMVDAMADVIPDAAHVITDAATDAFRDDMTDVETDASQDAAVFDAVADAIDAVADATPDGTPDAALDAMPDAAQDAMPDAMPDAIADLAVDAAIDAAPAPDAAPEPECRVDADCPPGDFCAGLICVRAPDGTCVAPYFAELGGEYAGATAGIGDDGGSCPGNNDLTPPEAIYRVSFPAAGPYCVNTRGSDFDTMLYVRTRCGDPATEVACQDDDFEVNGVGGRAALTLDAAANRVYYITVDGYGSAGDAPRAGDYRLSLTAGRCAPAAECTPMTAAADCGADRRCDDAGRCVDCLADADCPAGRCDPPTGACVGCLGDADCPGGRCDGATGACVGCLGDADCPADGACEAAVCRVPAIRGTSCAARMEILLGASYFGETEGVGALVGSCGALGREVGAPEAVFDFTAPAAGEYCVSTADSDFDTVLYLRDDCADFGSERGCSDDAPALTGGPQGALTVALADGQSVAVIVDGFAAPGAFESGAYGLRITAGACTPR